MATTGTGVAEPASKGGLFGRRKAAPATEAGVSTGRRGGFTVNAGARTGLALAQLLTAIAFLVVLAGLSSLQERANNLEVPQALLRQASVGGPQAVAAVTAAFQQAYINEFQSGNQIPYPGQGRYQFGLQWWILMFEIFIFLMIAVLLVMPRHLLRLKHAAMAFLVYVFVFTTLQIDSLLYFKRSANATSVYGKRRIEATLAGTIMGAVANALSIIFLGLLREAGPAVDGHLGHGGGKRVGADYGGGGANAQAGTLPGGAGHRQDEVVLPSSAPGTTGHQAV